MSATRVLVTGAGGFIGCGTLNDLLTRGYDVHAVQRTLPTEADRRVRWHHGDLHDHDAIARIVGSVRPHLLLHLAWDVTPGRYPTSHDNIRWLQSSLALFEAFAAHGGRRAVAAGTCAEYLWDGAPSHEVTTPLRPASLYAASKHATATVGERLLADRGVGFAWGRVFFLYGPNEPTERLVPALITAAMTGAVMPLRAPQQRRDYLHVNDVAAAFVQLLVSDVTGAVNIGSGIATPLAELARLVGDAAGATLRLADPVPSDDLHPLVVADITRLRDEVRFEPRRSLSDGLVDTVRWWTVQQQETSA